MNDKYNQAVEDLEHINDKLMQEQLKVLKYEEDITEYKENIEGLFCLSFFVLNININK